MLEPLLVVPAVVFLRDWIDPIWWLVVYVVAGVAWISVAATALRKPRLVVLAPALLVLDAVYRVIMLHAAIKAVVSPTIEICKWESPERFTLVDDGEGSSESSRIARLHSPVQLT